MITHTAAALHIVTESNKGFTNALTGGGGRGALEIERVGDHHGG